MSQSETEREEKGTDGTVERKIKTRVGGYDEG